MPPTSGFHMCSKQASGRRLEVRLLCGTALPCGRCPTRRCSRSFRRNLCPFHHDAPPYRGGTQVGQGLDVTVGPPEIASNSYASSMSI